MCDAEWPIKGGCLLYKDVCVTKPDNCYDLHIKFKEGDEIPKKKIPEKKKKEFYTWPYPLGCSNWKSIELSRPEVANTAECQQLCKANSKCTYYNFQKTACEPGWPVPNGCILFQGVCDAKANRCFSLTRKLPGALPDDPVVENTCKADSAPLHEQVDTNTYNYMTLAEGRPCLDLFKAPGKSAKATVSGLKEFFKEFYAFSQIVANPAADQYSFASVWKDTKLGIFGGEGGGAPAEQSRVDLIGGLENIAANIPEDQDVPFTSWMGPVNDLFTSMRDWHVQWYNGGEAHAPRPMGNLNAVCKLALLEKGKKIVLTFGVAGDPLINGDTVPVVKDGSGSEILSIGGQPPMEWLLKNLVEPSTISGARDRNPGMLYKSVGARMNYLAALFAPQKKGFYENCANAGSVDKLSSEPIEVQRKGEDGQTSSGQWLWSFIFVVKQPDLPTFAEVAMKISSLETTKKQGKVAKKLLSANELMTVSWKSPASRLLAQDEPVYDALPAANRSLQPAAPQPGPKLPTWQEIFGADFFADMPDVGGCLAWQKDEAGKPYGVFKVATFDGTWPKGADPRPFVREMRKRWVNFEAEAKTRGVDRLLIDVQSNQGGQTVIAWDLLQALFSDMPYKDTWGLKDRPYPEAAKMWKKINFITLEANLQRPLGLSDENIKNAAKDPVLMAKVQSNAKLIIRLLGDLHLLRTNTKKPEEDEQKRLDDSLAAAGKDEVARLKKIKIFFRKLWLDDGGGENPFADGKLMQMAFQHPEKKNRGGTTRTFSAQWPDRAADEPSGAEPTFTDIIFLSDGLCGSSCNMFVGGARSIAVLQTKRKVRALTYGGVGGSLAKAQETLSPTSYPGGNVQDNGEKAVIGPVLRKLLVGMALSNIIGDDQLISDMSKVWKQVMTTIPYYSTELPRFTQSELYMPPFGPHAPPFEFIFHPTDMYLPGWHPEMQFTKDDENGPTDPASRTQLTALYLSASRAFSV